VVPGSKIRIASRRSRCGNNRQHDRNKGDEAARRPRCRSPISEFGYIARARNVWPWARGWRLCGGALRQFASDRLDRRIERVRVVADFGRRHWRLPVPQLVAQHLPYLLKDALAPSQALEIALLQSAPEDRVIIRHFFPKWCRILRPMSCASRAPALNQLIDRL